MSTARPLIVITGAAGDVGSALAAALSRDYTLAGLDQSGRKASIPLFEVDLASQQSVDDAFAKLREKYGSRIASVIHLAAYFDFTGEEKPLYDRVNVQGTRHLLSALRGFEVEQLVYSGTMLVHEPVSPGERLDESQPIKPKWAYPKSKAAAEEVIRKEHGNIPYVLLHLAGLYDEHSCVPTLAQQIARIYERDFKSYLYSGDPRVGQSTVHQKDMIDAFRRCVERRRELPQETVILIGEPDPMSYSELQDEIGKLIHGEDWTTIQLPQPIAKAGAKVQEALEPVIPDAIDQGEKPFIRPFLIEMANDHYALDITRAHTLLGWTPKAQLRAVLPEMVRNLKADPRAWYEANGVTPPAWMNAPAGDSNVETLRKEHEVAFRDQHRRFLWAHWCNIAIGTWLVTSPPLIGLASPAMVWSDVISGAALLIFASLALSWRIAWARWACAAIGAWVMSAPILFWAPTAAGYLNDTLIGALIFGLAVALPPEPGVSRVAAIRGPVTPPGWTYNPSSFTQRLPIIALAFVGLYVSRYLAAYQLGHVPDVWEPFFPGGPDPKNGTEEIITSSVSEAWPVSDAAVGALTYLLEILTGLVGSTRRWRTMPWLVVLFGLMIAPLGVVSIFFIVIQPIWIGTWCTLCLIGAAAMLVQIPYSLDELLATSQFLRRRHRAGQNVLRVFFAGDVDEGPDQVPAPEFDRSPREIVNEVFRGGVNLPWNLALCALLGIWLMLTRLTLGAEGSMANADHFIGAMVLTVTAIACAEVARPVRFLNIGLGVALLITPFVYDATDAQTVASLLCGFGLIALSARRGPISAHYAAWDRLISRSA